MVYLRVSRSLLAQTKVERIRQVVFIVGAKVQDDGEGATWVDASCTNIKLELSDRNTDATDAQVAKAQNAGAIGNDRNVWGRLVPCLAVIANYIFDIRQIRQGEV